MIESLILRYLSRGGASFKQRFPSWPRQPSEMRMSKKVSLMTRKRELSHLDAKGAVHMVDVSQKPVSRREAVAVCHVEMSQATFEEVLTHGSAKGELFATVRLAGIQAAKQTASLIPLCHPLPLSQVAIDVEPEADLAGFRIVARVVTSGQTGVEMEAMTAASVAGLTLYDMLKSLDKGICLRNVCLLRKSGGKSGNYEAADAGF